MIKPVLITLSAITLVSCGQMAQQQQVMDDIAKEDAMVSWSSCIISSDMRTSITKVNDYNMLMTMSDVLINANISSRDQLIVAINNYLNNTFKFEDNEKYIDAFMFIFDTIMSDSQDHENIKLGLESTRSAIKSGFNMYNGEKRPIEIITSDIK